MIIKTALWALREPDVNITGAQAGLLQSYNKPSEKLENLLSRAQISNKEVYLIFVFTQ